MTCTRVVYNLVRDINLVGFITSLDLILLISVIHKCRSMCFQPANNHNKNYFTNIEFGRKS